MHHKSETNGEKKRRLQLPCIQFNPVFELGSEIGFPPSIDIGHIHANIEGARVRADVAFFNGGVVEVDIIGISILYRYIKWMVNCDGKLDL